jgi:hypothetical protein
MVTHLMPERIAKLEAWVEQGTKVTAMMHKNWTDAISGHSARPFAQSFRLAATRRGARGKEHAQGVLPDFDEPFSWGSDHCDLRCDQSHRT